MSRFYAPAGSISKDRIILRGREAHHARDVMRLEAGDEIVVFDGTGKEYAGIIEKISKNEIIAKINNVIKKAAGSCRLALAQAIPKLNKMDIIVEKATELGAERIIPVITERTVVQPDADKSKIKIERWKKLAVVASKQCGRVTIPEIKEIVKFEDSLSHAGDYELAIIPCLCKGTESVKAVLKDNKAKSAIVYIGPEGDFTQEETDAARSKGVIPVSLGNEVLRSDTAAISVLSILNYELRW